LSQKVCSISDKNKTRFIHNHVKKLDAIRTLRSAVRRAEKRSAGGVTVGTEPERNDRRRAADGSRRRLRFSFNAATSAREATAERALVASDQTNCLDPL
jgi:hypothetical protein